MKFNHDKEDLLSVVSLTEEDYSGIIAGCYNRKEEIILTDTELFCVILYCLTHIESVVYLPLSVIYGMDTPEYQEILDLKLSYQIEMVIKYISSDCRTRMYNFFVINANHNMNVDDMKSEL